MDGCTQDSSAAGAVAFSEKSLARFWAKVAKTPTCWIWLAGKGGGKHVPTYGRIRIDTRQYFAHRLSWQITFGMIPDGLCVLHHCDNPICVRPDHLFLGTLADNNHDMIVKGRQARGETHPYAKLTTNEVETIRQLVGGIPQREIAKAFHVSQQLVSCITRGTRRVT